MREFAGTPLLELSTCRTANEIKKCLRGGGFGNCWWRRVGVEGGASGLCSVDRSAIVSPFDTAN